MTAAAWIGIVVVAVAALVAVAWYLGRRELRATDKATARQVGQKAKQQRAEIRQETHAASDERIGQDLNERFGKDD